MKPRHPKPAYIVLPSRDGWVITFADMISLLLTVFVLLFSMTSLEHNKLQLMFGLLKDVPTESAAAQPAPAAPPKVYSDAGQLRQALEQAWASQQPAQPQESSADQQTSANQPTSSAQQSSANLPLAATPQPSAGTDPFGIEESAHGFAIRLSGDTLFSSGSAILKPEAYPLLNATAQAIKDTGAMLAIEGHSDNQGARDFNWSLSLKRAGAVLDYLVYRAGISPTRMALAGYGSSRPVASNEDDAGRAKNRRVEIVLLKDRF